MSSMAASDERGAFIIRYLTPPSGDDRPEHRDELLGQVLAGPASGVCGPTTTAWLLSSSPTERRPFMTSVEPVDTRSTMASARPSLGATSTAPLMVMISTGMPRSAKARRVLLGWLVAMRNPRTSSSDRAGLSLGTAASRRQRP